MEKLEPVTLQPSELDAALALEPEVVTADATLPLTAGGTPYNGGLKRLKPWHLEVMRLLFDGKTSAEIGAVLGKATATVDKVRQDPLFRAQQASLEQAVLGTIARGEHGAVAMARAEAETMMATLIAVAKTAPNMDTKRRAAKDVLAIIGIAPIKETHVTVDVHALFLEMTAAELEVYLATDQWPVRLQGKVAQLTAKPTPKTGGGQKALPWA